MRCTHSNKSVPIGGGMFVCFVCYMRLMFPARRRDNQAELRGGKEGT